MFTISKKKKEIVLEVIGGNATDVTGSCTKITFNGKTILFELGMIQNHNSIVKNYNENCAVLNKVKAKSIDMIIIGHVHCDHIGLIPMIFSKGNKDAKIIVPKNSKCLLKEMWTDCAYINRRDYDLVNHKSEKKIDTPLYTQKDVELALNNIVEIEIGNIINIDDGIKIRYTPAGHILRSCQTELFFTNNSYTKKILFTSDLGNPLIENRKVFVEKFKSVTNANICICESTYGKKKSSMKKKDIFLDRKKIKTVIEQFCIDSNHRVLIPTFSLDRMPFIIWELYQIFGSDKHFNIPVIIDSPLANRLLDCYSSILTDDAKEKFDKMMSWKNIKRIITPEDSKAAISENKAKIICASSGMLTAGRSIKWVQNILPNENDCILFIGYAGNDTLAGRIKNAGKQKTITINGKQYKNKCQIVDLHSFSSHMQHNELINYYKNINCEKIYLVHGDEQSRKELKEDLEKELYKNCKSTRVIIVNKNMKISI